MVYGGETWAVSAETDRKLDRTEMRMVRFMCGVRLRDKCTNSDVRTRLGIAIRKSRLQWFGHVERKADEDWVKRCTEMEVEGRGGRGRPKRIGWRWCRMICEDRR